MCNYHKFISILFSFSILTILPDFSWAHIHVKFISKRLLQYFIPKLTSFLSNEEIKHICLSLLQELKWYWTWYIDPVATEATVSIQGNSCCCLVSVFYNKFKVTERAETTFKCRFKYPSSDRGWLWISLCSCRSIGISYISWLHNMYVTPSPIYDLLPINR